MYNIHEYKIKHLTDKFYIDYPHDVCKEILEKDERPYNCLLFKTERNYYICIPYRSHIGHNQSFKFRRSRRSQRNSSGLDFSKIVIITDIDYLEKQNSIVDNDEYIETRNNIRKIINKAEKYVDEYIDYILNSDDFINNERFIKKYKYTTLKYFHKELGLPDIEYSIIEEEIFPEAAATSEQQNLKSDQTKQPEQPSKENDLHTKSLNAF